MRQLAVFRIPHSWQVLAGHSACLWFCRVTHSEHWFTFPCFGGQAVCKCCYKPSDEEETKRQRLNVLSKYWKCHSSDTAQINVVIRTGCYDNTVNYPGCKFCGDHTFNSYLRNNLVIRYSKHPAIRDNAACIIQNTGFPWKLQFAVFKKKCNICISKLTTLLIHYLVETKNVFSKLIAQKTPCVIICFQFTFGKFWPLSRLSKYWHSQMKPEIFVINTSEYCLPSKQHFESR